jgi:hypothetical protein
MILIISHPQDLHCRAVVQVLQSRGVTPALLDLSRFPTLTAVELAYGNGNTMRLRDREWGDVDLAEVESVWWRRPQPFGVPSEVTDPVFRAFAMSEAREAFGGLWGLLDAAWVNDPQRDDLAHRKAYQLRVAEGVGLSVPDTLITNNPERAREFISRRGQEGTIFKAFSGTPQAWRETRLIGEKELAQLDLVRVAPVIFQQYIRGVDLRVTVVGKQIFPAEINIDRGDYPVDFRMNYDRMRVQTTSLPAEVEQGIRLLMEKLGLVYGAIDFRRTESGEHVFLEINPAGQWLFIEQHTRQPITDAMADALMATGARSAVGHSAC